MSKKPTVYKEDKQKPQKIFRLTTAKMTLIMLSIVAVLGMWAIFETRENHQEQQKGETARKNYEYVYTNNTYIEEFQNKILIYDGYNLKIVNELGREEANVSLTAENFSIDTFGNRIFLVNIAKRITYVIDETGTVLYQGDIKYLPKRVVALENGGYAVHFITDILVEGVAIYNERCDLISEGTYPKITVTLIESSLSKGTIVIGLYRDAGKLSNIVYEYNTKGDLEKTSQIDNMLLIGMTAKGRHYVWQDINQIYVTDEDFNMVAKIESNNSYNAIEVTEESIYTLDDDNAITVINRDYEIIKESRFTEDIKGITVYKNEPLYYSSSRTVYNDNIKEYTKPIIKVISTKNSIIVVSRGELRFEKK